MHLGIVAWIILGCVAGWITGKLTFGAGFGAFTDLVAGAAGAIFGGIVSRHVGLGMGRRGLVGGWAMAMVGAIVLTWIVRLFSAARRSPARRSQAHRSASL